MFDRFAFCKAISIGGGCQGAKSVGVKRVFRVHMQVTKVGVARFIPVPNSRCRFIDCGVVAGSSINDRMLSCKQGLPDGGSLLLALLITTTATGQQ